ncbi:ADP-ribosylglycohydrolase family protein [Paradevosia shaoguanensis]|uniref:ADP-ribosylglycohydrolase family protein n=1 Tax=Paradevosia shaoguanensis TaxID=1335043 RepID=UPI001932BCFE|nr:ADP-ribosylglycohydrolase family protein [Paradevosia shaoguanensis]
MFELNGPIDRESAVLGCFLGGACGDELGSPVDFLTLEQIHRQYGPTGIHDFALAYGRRGAITSSTQMMLFTAEGIIDAFDKNPAASDEDIIRRVHLAYLRWLATQEDLDDILVPADQPKLLISTSELHQQRNPSFSSLQSLREARPLGGPVANTFSGPSPLVRTAPVSIVLTGDPMRAFAVAVALARLTHGHPSAYVPAGAFAMILAFILEGMALDPAIENTLDFLQTVEDHQETTNALIYSPWPDSDPKPRATWMGWGWTGAEALAIALHSVASSKSLEAAVIAAANHDGNSGATACLAGQLAGAMYGAETIPGRWGEGLELRTILENIATNAGKLVAS